MISKKMETALNGQINKETYAGYLYLSMAAYAADQDLDGFAVWMQQQAQEELGHAMKIYTYLVGQGARVTLKGIAEPPAAFKSPVHLFEEALAHEKKVTKAINELVELAQSQKDHATHIMLQWFVTEQIEEESTASGILAKLKRVGSDPRGLYMIDRELGARGARG